jgi:hypothetical protein
VHSLCLPSTFHCSYDFCRLKGHLHDPFHGSRSPSRQTKRLSHPNVRSSGSTVLHLPPEPIVSMNFKFIRSLALSREKIQ